MLYGKPERGTDEGSFLKNTVHPRVEKNCGRPAIVKISPGRATAIPHFQRCLGRVKVILKENEASLPESQDPTEDPQEARFFYGFLFALPITLAVVEEYELLLLVE